MDIAINTKGGAQVSRFHSFAFFHSESAQARRGVMESVREEKEDTRHNAIMEATKAKIAKNGKV